MSIIQFPIKPKPREKSHREKWLEQYLKYNRDRFPCNCCIFLPDAGDNKAWKKSQCRMGWKMKLFFPKTATWEMVLDDIRLVCGYYPVISPCTAYREIRLDD